jgi:hypothetical protein
MPASAAFCSWDVLRKRGNLALEHCRNGKPPVLVFDYDLIVDGRQLERPVNYMLLRIKPERGVATDPKKRSFVIVDPRAGHGPGIGSFKEESEVGVALLGTRAVSPANIHRICVVRKSLIWANRGRTVIARRPPQRSRRALLTHRLPPRVMTSNRQSG